MRNLVRSQTAARLKKLDREVRRVARHPHHADVIHDLRVSIRRLKQELNVFEEWFEPKAVKRIRRDLKNLLARCAAVRNCDIAAEILGAAGCPSPPLLAGLEKERKRQQEQLARMLEKWRGTDRVRKWRGDLRVGRSVSKESPAEYAKRLLPAKIEDLFRAGREAAGLHSSQRNMHRFRLKTKRVRYTLELFERVYGKKTETMLESLKGLQEKLGAINDCATTEEMILRDRKAAAAVRRLGIQREGEFRAFWKKYFAPREKTQWKAVLRAADGKK
jgi:CHAD domain-containing protein